VSHNACCAFKSRGVFSGPDPRDNPAIMKNIRKQLQKLYVYLPIVAM